MLWRRLMPVILMGLIAAGVVSSGPDGGNHHPRSRMDRLRSWTVMTGVTLLLSWTARSLCRRRPARATGALSAPAETGFSRPVAAVPPVTGLLAGDASPTIAAR